jgi:hypothetical protein
MKPILLGICSYDGKINIELANFIMEAAPYASFMSVVHRPTDVARNQIIRQAQMHNQNVICVDHDAIPSGNSFKAMMDRIMEEECVVVLPHCASGGQICVGEKSPSVREMETYSGITEVENGSTHTVGYNIKVFDRIKKPYYEYHYSDTHESLAGYSEDTVLHRKLKQANVKIYCLWDYWSDHVVERRIRKPKSLSEFEKMIFLGAE